MPPHIDINALTTLQIRELVVQAFRPYFKMMRGCYPKTDYTLTRTIKPSHPGDRKDKVISARLTPGGHFLFVKVASRDYDKGLCLYDLESADRCIWSVNPKELTGFVDYGFDLRHDGSIMLFLAVYRHEWECLEEGGCLFPLE